jgi:chromosome segregation ATPase
MQFTPLRQILDTRTQRRIRRIGLSDEINHIEREKRQTSNFERTLAALRQERDSLKDELVAIKQGREIPEDQLPSYESFWMSPQVRIQGLEHETSRLRDEVSVASSRSHDEPANEGETFMINDSAVIVSNSPDFREVRDYYAPVADSLMLDHPINHVSIQTETLDCTDESGIQSLTLDLEAARNEKKELFNACRSHINMFETSGMSDVFSRSSPPPDFFENLIGVLKSALARANDATQTLEGINQECSTLGFSGTSADDVISDIKSHFRSARLELERIVPGETPNGLEDGKATLGALVKRVKSLAKDLRAERKQHYGSLGREKALRGQFDNLLHRYEAAANKISNLEDSIASSAGDMLHTRMRMQELENEHQEKNIGLDRLNAALEKYHEDVKSLEELVGRLEDENLVAKDEHAQQISELEKQVAREQRQRAAVETSASEYESRIRQLEGIVEQNRIRACDLMAEVSTLEKEHEQALEALQQKTSKQLEQYEEDIGMLNVRISDLSTSLEETRSEAQRLRHMNEGLEEQLRTEIDARDDLLERWASEQARAFAFMKESVNSERRRAKVRAANWELKSDDLMSDGTTVMGSEPITPVSVTRFVDVEMGRGKNRRRMDSGIGILTEDELLASEDVLDPRKGLDSDIDLPTSGLIDF